MNKTSDPMVSVIMGVYNTRLDYLQKAVNSILDQIYENFEFVIVDDGSTDVTVRAYLIEEQRKDNRIKLILNKKNIGLTRSLNVAIENSSGKYIARMDSDDISLPNRLLTQIEYMENNPDICMTGTRTIIIRNDNEKGELINRGYMSDQRICEIHLLYENEGYAHPTFMLRKSFLDDHHIRYREDMKKDQDYALTTDCILAGGKRHLIEEPLLKYRIHHDQISMVSYDEQVECQAKTGSRRLQATFESLSIDECCAIARINHERQDYSPDVIITAIKKMIDENREKGLFDTKLFEREFRYQYYKKAMRISRINKKPWGVFKAFYVCSIPSVISVKVEDRIKRIKQS